MANSTPGGYSINYTIAVSDKYSQPLGNFSKSLEGVEKKAEEVSKKVEKHFSFKDLGTKLTSIGKNLSLYVSAPLTGLAVGAIKAAADFEVLQSSLTNFTGSTEKSRALLETLDTQFASSVFSLSQYAEASKLLLTAGTRVEDVAAKVKGLADIGAKFQIPVEALAQQVVMAKEFGFSLRQARFLASQGVPVFQELGKYVTKITGKKFSDKQLKEFLSQGRISGKAFEGVLAQMSAKGGIAFGGMDQQTNNLTGALIGLKNESHTALRKLGENINSTFGLTEKVKAFTHWIKMATEFVFDFSKANPEWARTIMIVGAALITIPPAIAAIGLAWKVLNALMIATPIGLIFAGIATGIALAIVHWDTLKAAFGTGITWMISQWNFLKDSISAVIDWITAKWDKIAGFVGGVFGNKSIVEQQTINSKSSASVNVNLSDPGNMVKSVTSHNDGLSNFNLGVNTSAMAY